MKATFSFTRADKATKAFASSKITLQEAKDMHTAYLSNPDAIQVTQENGTVETLKGLWFDKEDIIEILNRTDGKNVTHLFLMFGQNTVGNFQVITCGVENGNNADNGAILTDKMYDLCDPCPARCSTNIDIFDER